MRCLCLIPCCGIRPSSSDSEASSTADKTVSPSAVAETEGQNFEMLNSKTDCYYIEEIIGEGSFSKVAKCVNVVTSKVVAVKILKTERSVNRREINMLNMVSALDPAKTNVALFLEWFEDKGQTCFAFEMLDRSLHQLLVEREAKPLSLHEIRPIAQQLLTALDALKGIGVVHSDLKPDNVMLANHRDEPFRVKLIDFGQSFCTSENLQGFAIQPLGYRAPEVILGLPVSEAIDAWGLGCLLAWMYLAIHPFSIHCEYQSMRDIVGLLGRPPDHMIQAGVHTNKYFLRNQHWLRPVWRLKTEKEYQRDTGVKPLIWKGSLYDLIELYAEVQKPVERKDQRAFVTLLESLLQTDPAERITPGEALRQPFITMPHLVDKWDANTNPYVKKSISKMLVCRPEESETERPSENETSPERSLLVTVQRFFDRILMG